MRDKQLHALQGHGTMVADSESRHTGTREASQNKRRYMNGSSRDFDQRHVIFQIQAAGTVPCAHNAVKLSDLCLSVLERISMLDFSTNTIRNILCFLDAENDRDPCHRGHPRLEVHQQMICSP